MRALALGSACLLLASTARAVPGEVQNVSWCVGSKACLAWGVTPGATSYTVYRGESSGLPSLLSGATDSALAGAWPGTTTGEMLVGAPPSGGLYWYLVTASDAQGEGTAGNATSGPRQVNSTGTSCGDLALLESFDLPDGSPWPAPWIPVGSVAEASVLGGMARLLPTVSFYSLARMHRPLAPLGEANVEVTFSLQFEDVLRQGVGFYVRQNGGYLSQTIPHGQGYAVFVEGFRGDGIGVWKEQDGSEISLLIDFDPAFSFQNGVRYRVRFVVHQQGPTATRLQARVWRESDLEPTVWHVDFTDTTAVLQNVRGGLAVDSWSSITPVTPGNPPPLFTHVDDLRVIRLCD